LAVDIPGLINLTLQGVMIMSIFSQINKSVLKHINQMNSTARGTDAKTGRTVLDARGGNDKINVHQNIDGSVTVTINDKETHQFTAEEARSLEIRGGDGNDNITMTGQQLYGMPSGITIHGGNGDDRIYGGVGNDRLFGDAGNDIIAGGSGNDLVDGGLGNDSLYGQAGNDTIIGGAGGGYDYLVGGSGRDVGIGGREDYSVGIEAVPKKRFPKLTIPTISAR
jgi:Ca2+-binding RTX toxin-like protein